MKQPLARDKDIELRKHAVTKAIEFMEGKVIGNIDAQKANFQDVYKQIYYFLTDKPFQK